ncbi:MAG: hypothetical protein ABJH82_04925 [Polaribacter sp.]|uniref:hypothetical protein n=1 Tax=Polaribacter sp. TaxID=1920175 RepID=UPI003263A1F6
MRAKWYISTIFILLISFGAFQNQVFIPNQEIVLEFIDTKINTKDVENTIAVVKEKLLTIGVSNIKIKKTQNSTLKISYYSAIDIDNIKEKLVKENNLVVNKNSKNKEKSKNSSNYNIDIHELTNETDIHKSDKNFVFEIKSNSDRFTTYNYHAYFKKADEQKENQLFKTTYNANKNNPFIKDHSSHKEPEVRAGPKNNLF